MSSNGHRRPPRPRIELTEAASPREAAAVIAAIERFLTETAPVPGPAGKVDAWQRAALLAGIGVHDRGIDPWGEQRAWGARHSRAGRSR